MAAPDASVMVPTIVPVLVSCPKAGWLLKITEAKSMVITTVNACKREMSRVMWSPLKWFSIWQPAVFGKPLRNKTISLWRLNLEKRHFTDRKVDTTFRKIEQELRHK
jgi:hypothetical protein